MGFDRMVFNNVDADIGFSDKVMTKRHYRRRRRFADSSVESAFVVRSSGKSAGLVSPSSFLCVADCKRRIPWLFLEAFCRESQITYNTPSEIATIIPTKSERRTLHSFVHLNLSAAHHVAKAAPPMLSRALSKAVMAFLSFTLSASIAWGPFGGV